MAFCGNCGNELSGKIKFCPNCGAPIGDFGNSTEVENLNSINDNPVQRVQHQQPRSDLHISENQTSGIDKYGKFFGVGLFILSLMDIWTDPAILTIILSIGIIVGTVICISKKYKLKGFSIAAMVISILCLMSGLFQANRIGLFNKPTEESFSLTESSKKRDEDIHNTGRDYKKDSEAYLPSAKEKPDAQSDVSKKKSSGVDPDLKAFLDSYEDFVDEYVVFMKKYSSDPNNVASMLGEYSEIMARYADFAEKIDEYDSKTMSTEDAKYYIEVTSRCSQKMLDIYGK